MICTWHLVPGQLVASGTAFTLSGIAFHKALQVGLDPASTPIRASSLLPEDVGLANAGTNLWAQTVLQYQM